MIKTDKVTYVLHTEKELRWLLGVLDDNECKWISGDSLMKGNLYPKINYNNPIYICVQEKKVSWVREINISNYKTFTFIEIFQAFLEYQEHLLEYDEHRRQKERELIIPVIKDDSPFDVALTLLKAKEKNADGEYEYIFTIDEIKKIGQHLVNFAKVEGNKND